jgi:hypothetical protein
MLQIIDTAITLVFYTIIAVAAVLVLGAFFWIIDTIITEQAPTRETAGHRMHATVADAWCVLLAATQRGTGVTFASWYNAPTMIC